MADIPINDVARRVQFTSSGSAGPYSFSFAVLSASDLAVYQNATLKTLTTHYTVSLSADGTGTITFTSGNAPASGVIVTINSDQAVARTSDFTTGGDFKAATINDDLDRLTINDQQIAEITNRAVRAPITEPTSSNMVLPAKADRLDKLLGFNASTGNPEATTGRVKTVSVSTGSAGSSATASYTESTGALALAIPRGDTGATGAQGAQGAQGVQGGQGQQGATGAQGATGNSPGILMAWESATTDSDQGNGKIWLNNGTASSASIFYVDDLEAGGASINSLVDTFDDSTNTALRGTISVYKNSAPQNFHIFNVTGAVVSASTYSKITVAHVQSAGTISDGDAVSMQFSRTGNKGTDGSGSMTSFTMSDGSNTQSITDGQSMTFAAGSGLTAAVSATDTITYSLATNVDISGVATAATFEPDGDTAAGDNAAIGYTAAEGLILCGQGSSYDITLKNDADATVLSVPTGGTGLEIPGSFVLGNNTSGNYAIVANPVGDANNALKFKLSGDTASQLQGISWANNSGTVVANIWKTGDPATSAPLRINSLGTIQFRPREVGIDGDAPVAEISGTVNTDGLLKVTGTVIATTSTVGSQGGSTTLDFAANQNFVLTLTSNITLANPSTEQVGQSGIICFIQDAGGGNTLSLGTDYETAGGAGITLSTAGNAVDIVPYFVKASGSIQLGAVQLAFS